MGDYSVIVQGKDSLENQEAYYSTVHGAGRVMSRTKAAGKMDWKKKKRMGGEISPERMDRAVREFGVELRGDIDLVQVYIDGLDEKPSHKDVNDRQGQ